MSAWLCDLRGWLIDYYLVAGLFLLAVGAVLLGMRQPSRRLTLARCAVVGVIVLAVLTAAPVFPPVTLPIGPFLSARFTASAEGRGPATRRGDEAGAASAVELGDSVTSGAGSAGPGMDRTQPAARNAPARPIDIPAIVTCAFLGGAGAAVGWLALGAVLTLRLRYRARPAPQPIQDEVARLLGGRRCSTQVLLSDRVNQALAVGVLEPCIILPERFLGQETCEALEAALSHELAHIRHGDLRLAACLRLLLPVLFAHPLYWWLRSRVRVDQELLADAATGEKCDAAEYAEILLDWFRTNAPDRSRFLTATLGLWDRPHLIKRRIAMLLNERFRVETRSPWSWRVASWLAIMGAALPLSAITLRGASADAPAVSPARAVEGVTHADGRPTTRPHAGDSQLRDAKASPAVPDGQPSERLLALADQPTSEDAEDKEPERRNDTQYQNADEAWHIGAAFCNARQYAAARKPLEAALALAPDDKYRLKVYEALKPVYRTLSQPTEMIEACDFILRHADFEPKRTLTRSELLSFVYERGKTDLLLERYENVLRKDAKDRTALYVLSEAYARIKADPKRAADLTERLLALAGEGQPTDVDTSAKLAMLYVRQEKHRQGAELYEKIAPLDKSLAAWHWKEAATAWLKAGETAKSLAAAKKSDGSSPEKRSQMLTHFWHRGLGEVFLATGEKELATGHFERAIENTTIDGYLNDCRELLRQAKQR